ncbi:phosphatidylinositol phosphatase PTPRQ [Ixodes scapularis]
MSSDYFKGLDIEAQNRYREKLSFRGQELPDPLDGGLVRFSFSSDSRNFPPVTAADILMYLVEGVCFYTKEQFKSHKMGEAYNAFVSGKVKRLVSFKAGKRGEGIVVIAATVEASQTLTKAYQPWCVVQDDGTVTSAHCTCMAGELLIGDGESSVEFPEGTPTALNYSKKTFDKYEIFWGPVPCELANGVVRHYYLELDSADPWESRLVNHTTGNMRLGFSDLLPYTRYRAKVYAENDAGRSQVAAELNFTTSPAAPPPPSNLTADQLSRTNLSLSWRPPYPPQGVLERYQIKFRTNALRSNSTLLNVDQYQCSYEDSDLERHCFTVSNLLPVTIYRFSVRAFNGGTTHGPYSDELEIETGETVPDAPASVRCARREENSLKIQWDEPQRANGILKNYRVNVSLTHSFSSSVNASTRPRAVVLEDLTTREYNLSDLYPGTTYRVCVQASTTAGFGDAVCDLISTRAADPVVPMEPRVNGIVNSTINITLNSVDFVKGPITAYYVFVVRGSQDVEGPVVPVNFSDAQEMQLGYYTAAKFSHKEVRELSDFVLGAGNVVGGFENPPLTDATPYRIGLLVASNFSGEVRYGYRLSEPVVVGETDETSEIGIVLAAVLALLVLLALMSAALTCFCIRRRFGPDSQRKKDAQDPLSRLSKRDDSCLSDMRMTLSMDTGDSLNMTEIPKEGLPPKPAPATELQEYVTNGQAQDMDEYANFEIA